MSCLQTLGGILRDCSPSMGGIKRLAFANFEDIASRVLDDTSHKIDTITMNSSAKFKEYFFHPSSASMTSSLNVNADNGTNYVSTQISMFFKKMETSKRLEIAALSVAGLVALVQDANGVWWYLGYDEPMYTSSGEGATGAKREDKNGYTITIEDKSASYPYEILTGTGGVDIDSLID